MMVPDRGWTARAIVAGVAVGALLCATTLFAGLVVGFTDSGNITAAILGFALGRTILRGRTPYSLQENHITHTIAACMGGAPIAVGLLTIVPGLELLGESWSPGWMAAWGIVVGLTGVALAFAWRSTLLERQQLPFPTGIATAELVQAIHASAIAGAARARLLLGAATAGAALAWLRDLPPRWLPSATWMPGELFGRPCRSSMIGIAWSPLLVGLGGLVGLPVALAALGGSLIAWVGFAPAFVADPDSFGDVVAWVAWPATALLVAASLPAIIRAARRVRRGSGTPPRSTRVMVGVGGAALALVIVGAFAFGAPLWVLALGVALVPLGALLCAQSAGEIDIAPHGVVANLTIAGVGPLASTTASIGAGAAVGGVAFQVPTSLWALRAGERLGTPLRPQLLAQILGVLAGVTLAIPLYRVVVAAHGGVGTDSLPAAGAQSMRAFALLASEGGGIAATAAAAAGIALVGGAIVLATGLGRWLSIAGLGVGMLIPIHYAAAIVLGALIAHGVRRVKPAHADRVEPAAAGLVVGESVIGVTAAIAGAVS